MPKVVVKVLLCEVHPPLTSLGPLHECDVASGHDAAERPNRDAEQGRSFRSSEDLGSLIFDSEATSFYSSIHAQYIDKSPVEWKRA